MLKNIIFNITSLILLLFICSQTIATDNLPTLGQNVRLILPLEEEKHIGFSWMRQLNASGQISPDHIVSDYLQQIGNTLTSHIPSAEYNYTFFAINDISMNAFALLGGHVAVHDGLIKETQHESELAAVMAHEISHIKQYHIIRQVAENKRILPVAIAGALASALLGAPELVMPILEGHKDKMLKFSREHEQEADRIGIQLLARANYNPHAMVTIFQRIEQVSRYSNKIPEYLLTHPLFDKRIADASNRADKYNYRQKVENPNYQYIKTRLEVKYTDNKDDLIESLEKSKKFDDSTQNMLNNYKLAYAYMLKDKSQQAYNILIKLVDMVPSNIILQLTLANAEIYLNKPDDAILRLRKLNKSFPSSKATAILFGEILLQQGRPLEANNVLLAIKEIYPKEPIFYQLLSEAAGAIGKKVEMYEYGAEWHYLNYDNTTALIQLGIAKNLSQKNAFQTNRINKRINEIKSEAANKNSS